MLCLPQSAKPLILFLYFSLQIPYSLFVPEQLRGAGSGVKALESVPLATLEGEGSFRRALAAIARNSRLALRIEIECSSFPQVARAVGTGAVAAILPSVAAVELEGLGAKEIKVTGLDSLRREICLAWNPRVLRIRSAVEKASKVLGQVFRV